MTKGISYKNSRNKKAMRLDHPTSSRNRHVPPMQMHQYIQDKLNTAIKDPSFQFDFPELSSTGYLGPRDDRMGIYETIGDGILHGVVATEMYKRNPLVTRRYMVVIVLKTLAFHLSNALSHRLLAG